MILTGVISEKNALKSIDLKTIFLFGGTLSLASALQTTGAGEDIAKAGVPLILVATVVSMILLPILYPFFP